MALASPGVLVKEVDFTATVNVADQNIGVISIAAEKGPTDQVTYISSERELVEIFGEPNKYNYESWFAASTIIQYGAVAAVIRPVASGLGLNNANIVRAGTSLTNLLIKNKDEFESGTPGAYEWAARTPGANFNGISVAVVDHGADQRVTATGHGLTSSDLGKYVQWVTGGVTYKGNVFAIPDANTLDITLWDTTKRLTGTEALVEADSTAVATVSAIVSDDVYATLEYATGLKWTSIAPQPGTSASVKEAGGKYDEFHIAIIDTDGIYSGVKNSVLETLTFVSKSSDAKSDSGDALYWNKVVTNQSSFVYAGSETFADSGDQLALAGQSGTATDIGGAQLNATFKLFSFSGSSTESRKLASGAEYDWVNSAAAIQDAVVDGYDLVEDPEIFGDIDFLIPGKITASAVVRLIAIADKRRDCIVVASPERSDVINSNSSTKKTDDIISFFKTLPSTSYAIYDSGYKYIYDKYNDKYRYIPCSADTAGLTLRTEVQFEPWFSPAGFNRGTLLNTIKLAFTPNKAQRDLLYSNRVNPIVTFPGQGNVLYGDKTALTFQSAFDRINVRKLFLAMEAFIETAAKNVLFEQNDAGTRGSFLNVVEPFMTDVQGRRGVTDFLVKCDESNNPPDAVDRNEFAADIYVKPTRTINFITLTFVATRSGVAFSEVVN